MLQGALVASTDRIPRWYEELYAWPSRPHTVSGVRGYFTAPASGKFSPHFSQLFVCATNWFSLFSLKSEKFIPKIHRERSWFVDLSFEQPTPAGLNVHWFDLTLQRQGQFPQRYEQKKTELSSTFRCKRPFCIYPFSNMLCHLKNFRCWHITLRKLCGSMKGIHGTLCGLCQHLHLFLATL